MGDAWIRAAARSGARRQWRELARFSTEGPDTLHGLTSRSIFLVLGWIGADFVAGELDVEALGVPAVIDVKRDLPRELGRGLYAWSIYNKGNLPAFSGSELLVMPIEKSSGHQYKRVSYGFEAVAEVVRDMAPMHPGDWVNYLAL